jgi:CDGSH-type Zn-finger protein
MSKKISLPVAVEAGQTYHWCRCGLSATLPLCDNSHQCAASTEQPLAFVAEKTMTVYLCACGNTQDPPYCDGLTCDP